MNTYRVLRSKLDLFKPATEIVDDLRYNFFYSK